MDISAGIRDRTTILDLCENVEVKKDSLRIGKPLADAISLIVPQFRSLAKHET